MAVRRIVANIYAADPTAARASYEELLGLKLVTDFGWILTFASDERQATPQVSIVSEGGSGTQVRDLSIEVDVVNEIYGRAVVAGLEIVHPITDEPWGVRRFFVRDPFGKIVNIPVALSRSSPRGMALGIDAPIRHPLALQSRQGTGEGFWQHGFRRRR